MSYYGITKIGESPPGSIAHYGVKGMKWKNHIYATKEESVSPASKAIMQEKARIEQYIADLQMKKEQFVELFGPSDDLEEIFSEKIAKAKAEFNSFVQQVQNPSGELAHYGIKGQKWGVRRWQNEDGSLTEEGRRRYTYNTGRPGENRMSLAGRIKFGNKYANEFNRSEKEKAGWTKEKEKAWLEAENKKFVDEIRKEKTFRDLGKKLDKLDKLSDEEKQKVGDEILRNLEEFTSKAEKVKPTSDESRMYYELASKLVKQVEKKSGKQNNGSPVSDNYREASKKADEFANKLNQREDEIVSSLHLKRPKTNKEGIRNAERIQDALKKDSSYKKIKSELRNAQNGALSAILKDLGFADTPKNRSILFRYVFLDW